MGRRKLVRILLEGGFITEGEGSNSQDMATNIDTLNLQHERAIDIAQRKEHKEIVEMLKNPHVIMASHNATFSVILGENDEDGIELNDKTNNKNKNASERGYDKKGKKKIENKKVTNRNRVL